MRSLTLISLLAGLADVAGGWLALRFSLSPEGVDRLFGLGAGFMLGGALFTLVPAAVRASPQGALFVGLGYLGLLVLRLAARSARRGRDLAAQSAWVALAGLSFHSYFDGAALGAAALLDPRLGAMALVVIFLHKLPEGVSLASVVLAATDSPRLALLSTGVIGLATLLGGWSALVWTRVAELSHGALLGLAAGSFLYIAATDMVPGLMGRGRSAWLVLLGAAIIYLLAGRAGVGHSH
ncbi:MAG TPA: ZIP family metal transporter [Symbiobacteriaceae bacterium]|jgi:ZIP family zinc transporter/zinc and cadmium transporter